MTIENRRRSLRYAFCALLFLLGANHTGAVGPVELNKLVGQPVDIAPSAYLYRGDRAPDQNPPESWIGLIQYADLPYDKPVNVHAPEIGKVLCGLLWEEVRPIRQVELSWPPGAKGQPLPEEIVLRYFDTNDHTAHTWWNPRTIKEADKPEVSVNRRTYLYTLPADTWGLFVAVRTKKDVSGLTVPAIRVFIPEEWKKRDIEIEWGFDQPTDKLDYSGHLDAYDGIIGDVGPLPGDRGTAMVDPNTWTSFRKGPGRRGLRLSLLYMGSSRWRRVWPYNAQPEDVARTILTVRTRAGSFSFLASDLESGPILASEYGFFVRATSTPATARSSSSPRKLPVPPAQTLEKKMASIPGVPKIRGWASTEIPWFGVNSTREPGSAGNLIIPARSAAMHPGLADDVIVGWRSPIKGSVNIKGRVAMGDARGGNGIDWAIVLERKAIRHVLARGAIDTGGAQIVPTDRDAKRLGEVAVERGDNLALVVGAKGGYHSCDTTIIELVIAEIGGQKRVWDLTQDVVDSIHAGNPHADGLGNAGVWRFYATPASSIWQPPPVASEPPFKLSSAAQSAREFRKERAALGLKTIRQRVREHPEQSWEEAVAALHPNVPLPPHPKPPFEPAMQVAVPSERLTAQWNLGAWHILRQSLKDRKGKWHFNDYPFGILASETYMILRALDLQAMHKEAADGLDQWLSLPMQPRVVPGRGGHHEWARPDRPLGHFADGRGCLTHAEGYGGVGGHMDGVHCMGPGAIMFTLVEHFRLTRDLDWLKAHAPRMKANADWILRQRQLLRKNLPNGERLWSKGLQPAHVVTPDSERMHMQFYETEAYYWLGVKRLAELLTLINPEEGAKLATEADAYRADLLAALDRSIALTPVVPVRDGTYRSFVPFAPYARGFAAGAWGWRRCQGHVGAIYWDTVQSADPLISPSGLLSPHDPRVQGHLDVLEDRLLLENTKLVERTNGYDPEKHWFAHAGWQYQCGLERHANIHLAADDVPNALRAVLNEYAVDIMPKEYTFREHTTGGPPDKVFEEACFLERFRDMLVMEDGEDLWLTRATPCAWLQQGRRIAVRNAPTHFGTVDYEVVSDVDHDKITAGIDMPARNPPRTVFLRLRHPARKPIKNVTVDGKPWKHFDRQKEIIELAGLRGKIKVTVGY